MTTFLPSYLLLQEPELLFHYAEPRYVSINPLEGLEAWGPYDSSIPGNLRPNPLRLALISPADSFGEITRFLTKLTGQVSHTSGDAYVVDWPGFRKVFQTNLEIPTDSGDRLVQIIPEAAVAQARSTNEPEVTFLELMKRHIRILHAIRHEFDVLVIYIPRRWADFREKRGANYEYDLHDALKVFGAPNNIKIQLIEEDSLTYPDQARVLWWLGLGLYVKAGGIPWKLASATQDTAYVGLSYGISNVIGGKRIIMGCSQVFDERGEGLKFLLYPMESPAFKRENPYLSREDARRLFGNVRDIYQDANGKPPHKVVVHKTTHFTNDEMAGIAAALDGIDNVELLQIQQDTTWRVIDYDHIRKETSGFPVRRGMVLPLDGYSFLLWTQGDLPEVVTGGKHYYQEKRGIPRPLLVRRFRGKESLEETASQILQLTKMNWNNGQLYSRLPVTLDLSSKLSKIAKQVEGAWKIPYDFRFFL